MTARDNFWGGGSKKEVHSTQHFGGVGCVWGCFGCADQLQKVKNVQLIKGITSKEEVQEGADVTKFMKTKKIH